MNEEKNTVPNEEQTNEPQGNFWKAAATAAEERAAAKKEANATKTGLSMLLTAIRDNSVLFDYVVSVESNSNGSYWVIYRNDIEIRIPYEDSSEDLPPELVNGTVPRYVSRQHQMMKKSIGVKVPYIPVSIETDEQTQYIRASTVRALNVLRYSKIIRNGFVQKNGSADLVLTSVSANAVYGLIHGVEVHLPKWKTVLRHIKDLRAEFAPGQTIRVKVLDLKIVKDNGAFDNKVEMEVSGRQYEIEEAIRKNRGKVRPNSEFAATITSIHQPKEDSRDPRPILFLCLNGINYPAICRDVSAGIDLPEDCTLESGDEVRVRIRDLTQSGFALVKITRVIKYN